MGGDRAASSEEPAGARRVISGIPHALKVGRRWCDCPADDGLSPTMYKRLKRWWRRGFWLKLLNALVDAGAVAKSTAIDSAYVKAQRAAFRGKGAVFGLPIVLAIGGCQSHISNDDLEFRQQCTENTHHCYRLTLRMLVRKSAFSSRESLQRRFFLKST